MFLLNCYPSAFSSFSEWGLLSSWHAQASSCSRCSCCRAQILGTWASVVVVQGCSCLASGEILVPGPGIKPVPPPLAGRLSTTRPPGNSPRIIKYLEVNEHGICSDKTLFKNIAIWVYIIFTCHYYFPIFFKPLKDVKIFLAHRLYTNSQKPGFGTWSIVCWL